MAAQFYKPAGVAVSTTSYPGSAQFTAGFTPDGWTIYSDTPTRSPTVIFSFDGTNDAGEIRPGDPDINRRFRSLAVGGTTVFLKLASLPVQGQPTPFVKVNAVAA